jgi:peptidoglycan/xylan/chitin deacetylase (PgdA/CDA1 family)
MNAVSEIDYDLIMWSIDTIDWQRPNPETINKRVINKLHNDAIILMHPTDPTSKALPEMLKSINELGYEMVTIDKILIDQGEDSKENASSV